MKNAVFWDDRGRGSCKKIRRNIPEDGILNRQSNVFNSTESFKILETSSYKYLVRKQ
jgi:hypothetical protein